MIDKTRKPVQAVPGLALQIQVQRKIYAFKHGEIKTKRNYTLGGLYPEDNNQPQANGERTTTSSVHEDVWDNNPTPSMRTNLGDTLYILPAILTKLGVGVLDSQLKTFHEKAKGYKQIIAKRYPVGSIIPLDIVKKLEDSMKPYNLEGYTLKVTAIKVTESNDKGSRKRSDGYYEQRQVLRTVYIDRLISEEVLNRLFEIIVENIGAPVIENISVTAGFTVSEKNGVPIYVPRTETRFEYEGKQMVRTNYFGTPPGAISSSSKR